MSGIQAIGKDAEGNTWVQRDSGEWEKRTLPEGSVSYNATSKPSLAETVLTGPGFGASAGLTTPISAAVGALTGKDPETGEASQDSFLPRYRKWNTAMQERVAARQREHPVADLLTKVAGGALTTRAIGATGVSPFANVVGQSAVQAASNSPAQLTKVIDRPEEARPEVARELLDTGVGTAFGAGTYGLFRGIAGLGQRFGERHAAKAGEALAKGTAQGYADKVSEMRSAAGAIGGEQQNVNRVAVDRLAQITKLAESTNADDVLTQAKELAKSPQMQELYRDIIGRTPGDASKYLARTKAARDAFERVVQEPVESYVAARIPGIAGGSPKLHDAAHAGFMRYGEPILGKIAAQGMGGLAGMLLGGGETGAEKMTHFALGAMAGGTAGGLLSDRARPGLWLKRRLADPGTSYELHRNLSRLANNTVAQNPSLLGVAGNLVMRASSGDHAATAGSDFLLSQISPSYRKAKRQMQGHGEHDEDREDPGVGF